MKQIFRIYILLITGAVSFCTSARAQSGVKVTGTVADDLQKPLDYAAVALLKAADSSMIRSVVTDLAGNYIFENVENGNYLLVSSIIGHKKAFSKPFTVNGQQSPITIEKLVLVSETKSIKEVTVVYKKPFIERKMDRLVINVENSTLSAGNTAMEVLEKAPGITVDKDDNISMKGKQGVLITIDGKQTYMSSADVANMLRNMQSDQLESIELITSPSARYDAEGTSGIINIKTRKNKNLGLNGTFTAGTGYGEVSKFNGGTALNYRNKNLNLFGNYNYANNGRINTLNLNREVNYLDTTTTFGQLNDWNNRRNNNSFKAGADYFIDQNNTIGVLINGYSNGMTEKSTSYTNRLNNFDEQEIINVLGNNTEKFRNMAYNINYKGTLDTLGKELSVDLDYSDYKGSDDEIRNNAYTRINLDPRNNLDVKNYSPSVIKVKSLKADYTHPFSKTTKLEAGLKLSLVATDNNLLLAELDGNTWVPDPEYTNRFKYNEDIYAAYFNFSREMKTTDIQVGLRAENTFSEGNSVTKNQVVKRKYLELFPSFSIGQKIGANHQLGFSYSRRIDRPEYGDLNPFLNFLDEYTFQKGNPYLNPQFTNAFDLSHTYKGGITTTLNYSLTKNAMTTVTEQDDATQKTYAIERNLDEQRVIGVNVYAPVKISGWWSINNNLQVFNMRFKSKSAGGDLDAGQTAVTYNMSHSFSFSKTFGADASLQYQSPLQYGIFKVEAQTVFNAGIRKSFNNNKVNLRFNMDDIFNSRRNRLSTTYQNMNLNIIEKGESRIARISLSYRFGSNEIKSARNHSTGLEDESGRMKN